MGERSEERGEGGISAVLRPGGERRAVVDVGTNSVKLLVGDLLEGGAVEPVWEASEQTRLGAGFYTTHLLQRESVARTARAVGDLVRQARTHGAERVGIVATSAAREARNADELYGAIQAACGLPLQVISGDQEAEWVYRGVRSERAVVAEELLVLDVGGGSSEVVIGHGPAVRFRRSFRLGTVRCLEQVSPSDPPTSAELERCRESALRTVENEILPAIRERSSGRGHAGELVAASGTATILARLHRGVDTYDRRALEGVVLDRRRLGELRKALWSVPLAVRRTLPGMPPDRADVMLTGAVIYETLVSALGGEQLRVSLRGLRFGALVDLWPVR